METWYTTHPVMWTYTDLSLLAAISNHTKTLLKQNVLRRWLSRFYGKISSWYCGPLPANLCMYDIIDSAWHMLPWDKYWQTDRNFYFISQTWRYKKLNVSPCTPPGTHIFRFKQSSLPTFPFPRKFLWGQMYNHCLAELTSEQSRIPSHPWCSCGRLNLGHIKI